MQYANKLCENGFETPKLFSFAHLEDFEKLGIPLGHQRALSAFAGTGTRVMGVARGGVLSCSRISPWVISVLN